MFFQILIEISLNGDFLLCRKTFTYVHFFLSLFASHLVKHHGAGIEILLTQKSPSDRRSPSLGWWHGCSSPPLEQDAPLVLGCRMLVSTGKVPERDWSISAARRHPGERQRSRAQPNRCREGEPCLTSLPLLRREGVSAQSFNLGIPVTITGGFTAALASEHVSPPHRSGAAAFKGKRMGSSPSR